MKRECDGEKSSLSAAPKAYFLMPKLNNPKRKTKTATKRDDFPKTQT